MFKSCVQFFLIFSLLSSSSFARTYSNTEIKKFLTSNYSNWGLIKTKNKKSQNPSINIIKALQVFNRKNHVTVAVVDTGIVFKHPHLKNNIVSKVSQTKKASKIIKKYYKGTLANFGMDFSNAHLGKAYVNTSPADYHGHGTHVAGIIKGVYEDVKIIPVKYFNQNASGEQNLENSIKALEYAVDLGVDIINYSGGGPEADPKNKKRELAIVKKAQKKGIILVAAAGNNGSNIDIKQNNYFPASYNLDNIISVGAYNEDLQLISSSNYGVKTVEVAAPGYKINSSTTSMGTTDAFAMSGTSQATAFVSGIAALLKSAYPGLSYKQIKSAIVLSCHKIKSFRGKIKGGQVDAYEALKFASKLVNDQKKREVARAR